MRSSIWLWLGWLLLVASPALAATPELVGEFGDPDRIQFIGNTTFDAKLIRAALRYNVEVLVAGHPRAGSKGLLQLLQRRLHDGYLHAGFAQPDVNVQFDDSRGRIVATINEGLRYQCGDIEVTGADTLPISRFVDALLKLKTDGTGLFKNPTAIWQKGRPPSFSAEYWESKRETIQGVFRSLGYYDASFSVNVHPRPDRTATLVIAIKDEGPRALLGEIDVVGVVKNSADDVIRLLDLTPGMVLDADAKAEVEQKLFDSGRFLKHDVEILTPPFGNDAAILRINLVEYDHAPALTENFSPEQQALVRFAQWSNQFDSFEDDLVATFAAEGDANTQQISRVVLRVAISPQQHSCLLHLLVTEENQHSLVNVWLHLTPASFELAAPDHSLRFLANGLSQRIVGSISWTANPPAADGLMTKFKFGIGVNGNAPRGPFAMKANIAPAAAIQIAHKLKDSLTFKDDILSIDLPELQIAIDGKTGRIMRWTYGNPQASMRLTFESGGYKKLLAELDKAMINARTIAADDYPISNLLTFVANCLPDRNPMEISQKQVGTALAHSLLKRGTFHPFDTVLTEYLRQPDDNFTLPPSSTPSPMASSLGWSVLVLPISRLVVPSPSWPFVICRESVFAESRYAYLANATIDALLSDRQSGPLMNLYAARVLGRLRPQWRIEFARLGMTRLERERFKVDCEPLLDSSALLGKLLLATTQTLQQLDDSEIETLVSQFRLSEHDRGALSHALRLLPAHQNDEPLDAIRIALDDAWEPLIEPHLRTMLKLLAN